MPWRDGGEPMPYRIAVLPGDGIGPDVVAAAQRVAEAAAAPVEWLRLPVGLPARAEFAVRAHHL